MTLEELDAWLDRYGRAWERRDVEGFTSCFAEDAVYRWGPFNPPLRGQAEIAAATEAAVSQQAEIAFEHEPLAVTPDGRGIAWWAVTYVVPETGKRIRDEGIFLVVLGPDGRCTDFREWWNERELDG